MDLVKLASNKGFISRNNLIKVNNDYYYLWLCELQKWLREKHNIIVYLSPVLPDVKEWGILIFQVKSIESLDDFRFYKTYKLALEKGLQKALKLIENGTKNIKNSKT